MSISPLAQTPRGNGAHFAADTVADLDLASPQAASAVSWGAIFAGAVAAAAASLALLALGTGLGLSSISPWAQRGVQASTFGVASIVWVIVTQLCASALGGYLAGRLRTRWTAVHTDEVYFRDTAHGLLSWAVASLVTAALLLSAAFGAVGTAVQASATAATGAAVVGAAAAGTASRGASGSVQGEGVGSANGALGIAGAGSMGYLIDSLFRKDATAISSTTATVASSADSGADTSRVPVPEVTRIFANSIQSPVLPPQDVRYLGQLVAQRTGIPQADAERRVTDAFTTLQTSISNAKAAAAQAAETARKLGIQVTLWLFVALLSGAFIASFTATLGGRERDA